MTGALQFTQAHSNSGPPGALFDVNAWEHGSFLYLGSNGWMACPSKVNNQTEDLSYQIFAQLPKLTFGGDCVPINILTADWVSNRSAAAWEYV